MDYFRNSRILSLFSNIRITEIKNILYSFFLKN